MQKMFLNKCCLKYMLNRRVFLRKKCKDTFVIIFYVESDNAKEKKF